MKKRTENRKKIETADEFVESLDGIRASVRAIIRDFLSEDGMDALYKETLEEPGDFMEMRLLSEHEDRALALEAFYKLDEDRRKRIIATLHGTAQGIRDEMDRRSRGILPEPGTYYADDSTEYLGEWLSVCERFAGELGLTSDNPDV